MTIQVIKTVNDGTGHYRQRTALDGVSYSLEFDFNARDEHWYMTVSDIDGNNIAGMVGMKLVQNWFPSRLARSLVGPRGQFLVSSETFAEPGLTDLGRGTLLFYIPADDWEDIHG